MSSFVKDPFMRLKRKKLGSSIFLREGRKELTTGAGQGAQGGGGDTPPPLALKGKKTAAHCKRKQAMPSSMSAPRGQMYTLHNFINVSFFYSFCYY